MALDWPGLVAVSDAMVKFELVCVLCFVFLCEKKRGERGEGVESNPLPMRLQCYI